MMLFGTSSEQRLDDAKDIAMRCRNIEHSTFRMNSDDRLLEGDGFAIAEKGRNLRTLRFELFDKRGLVILERNTYATDSEGRACDETFGYFLRYEPKNGTPLRWFEPPGGELEGLYESLRRRAPWLTAR